MKKKKKGKNVIEVKFDSSKEKIFIFTKEGMMASDLTMLLKIMNLQQANKIFILPKDIVDSVTIIKDVKKDRIKKRNDK